jgi:two-component system sensor histidine kinase UhpB
MVLSVQDDGSGFDVAAMRAGALAGGSMGVLGMQERAALIGGEFDIQSAPGHGCTVIVHFPLRLRGESA